MNVKALKAVLEGLPDDAVIEVVGCDCWEPLDSTEFYDTAGGRLYLFQWHSPKDAVARDEALYAAVPIEREFDAAIDAGDDEAIERLRPARDAAMKAYKESHYE